MDDSEHPFKVIRRRLNPYPSTNTQFYHSESHSIIVRRLIKTSLYFEARFRIKGKVLQSMMCAQCEAEGELYIRIPRQPSQNPMYNVHDPSTYMDNMAFDPRGSYLKLKPGDMISGDVICF